MLHWAKVRQTDIHQWALAKALCARLVYDFMSEPARQAVEATISFGKGEISKEQLLPYYNMALSSAAMAEARSTISMANYAAAYACNLENYYNSPAYSAFKVLDRKERVLEWCADICRSTITLDTSKPIKVESIWLL